MNAQTIITWLIKHPRQTSYLFIIIGLVILLITPVRFSVGISLGVTLVACGFILYMLSDLDKKKPVPP